MSPLWKHVPNAAVDENGVITEYPYWRVAKSTTIAGASMCRTCGAERVWDNVNGNRICRTCGRDVNYGTQ